MHSSSNKTNKVYIWCNEYYDISKEVFFFIVKRFVFVGSIRVTGAESGII